MPNAGEDFGSTVGLRAIAGSGALQATLVAAQFGSSVILARILGVRGFGAYAFVASLALALSAPLQLGLRASAIHFLTQYSRESDAELSRGAWRQWGRYILGFGAATAAGLLYYAALAASAGNITLSLCLVAAIGLVIVMPSVSLYGAAIQVRGFPVWGQVPEFATRPIVFLLLCLCLLMYARHAPLDAYVAVALNIIAGLIALSVARLWLRRTWPTLLSRAPARMETRRWLKSLVLLAVAGGASILVTQIDLLMLGWLTSVQHVGTYRVAVQMATLAMTGLYAVNRLIAPRIAKLYIDGSMAALQSLMVRSARLVFLVSVVPALTFIIVGGKAIELIFGRQYSGVYVALSVLCVCRIVSSCIGPVGTMLSVTGHERQSFIAVAVSLGIELVLCLILVPRYREVGAALASGVTFIILGVLTAYFGKRCLGINSTIFSRVGKSDVNAFEGRR